VGAVVVGLDPNINYYKLQYGTLCVRENPGCLFIATNRDAVGHMTDLQEWPGMVTRLLGLIAQNSSLVVTASNSYS
jgi:ribonucleotide monophosphatase NagD (HAD superfamily)